MATTVFDPSEDRSDAEKAAEASALEQGEKIAQMQEEDKARRYAEADASNENPELIGGKFKSQDELLKAYEELQKKMSSVKPPRKNRPVKRPSLSLQQKRKWRRNLPTLNSLFLRLLRFMPKTES